MFIVSVKTLMIEIVEKIFNSDFTNPDFRNLWVSMEYPDVQAAYPGIWVDFQTTQEIQDAGMSHVEWVTRADGTMAPIQRWRFTGVYSFTCVAMTSLQRDLLLDELVRVMAFENEENAQHSFRYNVEHNGLVGLTMQFDRFALAGKAENPGTPWGTDDVVYEETISVDCEGSFCSSPSTGQFVPLSAITITEGPNAEELDQHTVGIPGNAQPTQQNALPGRRYGDKDGWV